MPDQTSYGVDQQGGYNKYGLPWYNGLPDKTKEGYSFSKLAKLSPVHKAAIASQLYLSGGYQDSYDLIRSALKDKPTRDDPKVRALLKSILIRLDLDSVGEYRSLIETGKMMNEK